MIDSYPLKNVPAPARILLRPILLAAIGLHALLLFIPLPAEQKPREADDKKNPIKITQLPTAQPPAAKPRVTVQVKATPQTSSPARTSSTSLSSLSSLTSSSLATAVTSSISSAPPRSSLPSLPTSLTPTSESSEPVSAPATEVNSVPTVNADPVQALYELLAEIPPPQFDDPAATNVARKEHFIKPELFFRPSSDPDEVPEGLPGLDGTPLLAVGEEPKYFYETFFEQPLKVIFQDVTKVGEYADGPLYKLQKGNYTIYLSLTQPQGIVGTIVSVWKQDPRS